MSLGFLPLNLSDFSEAHRLLDVRICEVQTLKRSDCRCRAWDFMGIQKISSPNNFIYSFNNTLPRASQKTAKQNRHGSTQRFSYMSRWMARDVRVADWPPLLRLAKCLAVIPISRSRSTVLDKETTKRLHLCHRRLFSMNRSWKEEQFFNPRTALTKNHERRILLALDRTDWRWEKPREHRSGVRSDVDTRAVGDPKGEAILSR